jgi:hypothetical protein
MLKRRKLSGWTRFMTIYTVAVCALFVLLVCFCTTGSSGATLGSKQSDAWARA